MRTPLDPQVESLLASPEYRTLPPWHSLSIEAARTLEDELFSGDRSPPVEDVVDVAIPGPAGELPVRIYRTEDGPRPALVYYHGGGWTLGTLDSVDGICRELATRTDAVVVSVDYRLAPEHPFPDPLEDAIVALEWVAEHADSIGVDRDRLGVAGTSAGGNLAAATARYVTAVGEPSLSQQVLLYPMIDCPLAPVVDEAAVDGPLLSRADVRWFWEQYLRHPVDGWNPFASLLRASHEADLPPTTVVTCGHDPLCPEGIAYAEALADADVDVAHEHCPSLPHGALSLVDDVDRAEEAMAAVAATVRSRFATVASN